MPYKTVYKEDPTMYEGQQKVLQQGIKGEEIVYTKKNYTTNNRNPLIESLPDGYSYSEIMEEPQDEIILRGTRVNPLASRGYDVQRMFIMKSTGYSREQKGLEKGITKSGRLVQRDPKGWSTVAVDTSYIKLGTKMWSPQYGFMIASDTGSAIKGQNRVDLYFNTIDECVKWGVRNIEVWILED